MNKKIYLSLLALLICSLGLNAQDILIESFDTLGTNVGNWQNSTAGSYTLVTSDDKVEGDSSIFLTYDLVGDQGWGGSVDLQVRHGDGTPLANLSGTGGLSIWFKVTQVASTNDVSLNAKIFINSTGGMEQWHSGTSTVLGDASGEWTELRLPYSSFAIPNWEAHYDEVLYLDKIQHIEFQVLSPEGPQTTGAFLLDNLSAYEMTAAPVYVENILIDPLDSMGSNISTWANSTAGTYSLTSSTSSYEGAGALCMTYELVGDQGWGGSFDIQVKNPDGGLLPDLTGSLGITFWYKVAVPATPAGVTLNTKIFVNSTGGMEQWHAAANSVLGDASGEWQQAFIPFTSYAIPSWEAMYDRVLYLDNIQHIEFQVIGPEGSSTTGAFCLDRLASYVEQETGVKSVFVNTVKVLPNPVVEYLRIDGSRDFDRVEVFSMNGSTVKVFRKSETTQMDVSSLTPGMYVMRAFAGNEFYLAKFVKE